MPLAFFIVGRKNTSSLMDGAFSAVEVLNFQMFRNKGPGHFDSYPIPLLNHHTDEILPITACLISNQFVKAILTQLEISVPTNLPFFNKFKTA